VDGEPQHVLAGDGNGFARDRPHRERPERRVEVVGPGAEGHEDGGRERACCGPVVGGSSAARSVQPDGATQLTSAGLVRCSSLELPTVKSAANAGRMPPASEMTTAAATAATRKIFSSWSRPPWRSVELMFRLPQLRAGNTPWRAMMKVRLRNGGMLLCGRLPPVIVVARGLIATFSPGRPGGREERPGGIGRLRPGAVGGADQVSLCGAVRGHRLMAVRGHLGLEEGDGLLTAGFAQVAQRQPGTLAGLERGAALQVGEREVRLAVPAVGGSEQENSAVFWEMGSSWPSHSAQPVGAKVAREDPYLGDEGLDMGAPRHRFHLSYGLGRCPRGR